MLVLKAIYLRNLGRGDTFHARVNIYKNRDKLIDLNMCRPYRGILCIIMQWSCDIICAYISEYLFIIPLYQDSFNLKFYKPIITINAEADRKQKLTLAG